MRGKWLTGLAEWMASLGWQWHGWVGGSMRVRELESERYFVSKKKKKIDGPIVVFENVAIGYYLLFFFCARPIVAFIGPQFIYFG